MPNVALFIAVACALYAGNVSAGPIPHTNAVLPRDAASTSLGTSRFPPPEVAITANIDAISSRDLITSDINLHGHQSSQSVERRDPIYIGLAVRSPTGNPSPPPTLQELEDDANPTIDTAPPLPTLPNPDPDTIHIIRRLKQLRTEGPSRHQRALSVFKEAFDLIHDFYLSLGAQSVAQKEHQPIEVKQWITTAEKIQQAIDGASDDQTSKSKYPKEITEAALRLLEVAKNDSMENKKLTSDQVKSMVTTFTKDIESLEKKRQASNAELNDDIIERMNLNVQLLNRLTRGLGRDRPAYDRLAGSDVVKFAESQLEKNPCPKVQAAARSLLKAFGKTVETNEEPLVEGKSHIASDQGKKRKADDAGGSTGGSSDAKQHKKE